MRRQFAVFLAFCVLAVIASGAALTTLRHTATLPENVHIGAGIGVGVLCFVLGVWCLLDRNPVLRWLGIFVSISTGVEAMSRAVLIHACFAAVLLAAVAAVAMFRPVRAMTAPEGSPWLRGLVNSVPPVVFLQIALGAAARHEILGVIPHIVMALPLIGSSLAVAVSLLRRYPDYRPFRSLAKALIAVVLVQAPLGIIVFVMRLLQLNGSFALATAAAAHVTAGALILTISSQVALQYQRSVI